MKGDTMETFDIMAIIAKAMDAGHTVKLEQGDIVVSISPAAPEQKKEEPKKKFPKKKELDVPKMKALREAGWTLKKIAEEMGCAIQTVANKLKEVEHE